ncbi:MAG TPA: hypothetical protein VMU29_04655 [Smithella sp.]|nr:hypothetical protein [Smithella sp.]
MPKPVMSFLLIVGCLFFLMGIGFSRSLAVTGIVMMAVALFMALKPDSILRKDQVEDSWSTLIENAQGRSEDIFRNAEEFTKENNVDSLIMTNESISPGFVSSMLGTARKFLVVVYSSFRLKPYQIFVNARDFGNNLDVSWYLTYRPSIWQVIASLIPFVKAASEALRELDLFDQQDLRAYATIVHRSVLKSVDKLMLDLKQDPSKMERRSRGFLGIS